MARGGCAHSRWPLLSLQHSADVIRCLSGLVKKKLVHPVKKLRERVNFVYMHILTYDTANVRLLLLLL